MAGRFVDRSVLITGAGSGIGRATAQLFAAEGARVAVVDQNEADAEKTVALIKESGGDAIAIAADVSLEADCRGMVERAVSAHGKLNIAFNNAGVGASGFAVADEEEIAFSRLIDVNLKGVFLSMKYEIPAMLAAGGGAIVNTASVAGLVGERGIGAYAASKHGVVGLSRTAALDYIGRGIRINAVCPGATRTRILADWFQDPKVEQFILSRHPIGRIAEPEEIGRAVMFLASDDASFVVGHALAVDGGLTAQ
ncbi:MAG TPA: glucose 1-dehydrogenase [Xanthobacteraceae bacterium]|jgi:NAD(P)-dependent dehydrogenase (short-subunit alcohol dehydrogenase family)